MPADRVEDVIQDVLVTVHRVRHTYDPARPFTPWLRAIAQRRAIDVLRSHGRHRTREIHAPVMYESHPDPAPTAAQRLEQSAGADALRAAVAALPEGQRQAVEELSKLSIPRVGFARGICFFPGFVPKSGFPATLGMTLKNTFSVTRHCRIGAPGKLI